MGDLGSPDRSAGADLLTLLLVAWAREPSELLQQARAADDPAVAERLLREAMATDPDPNNQTRAALDLARVLGPGAEAELLLHGALQSPLRAEALAAQAELAWASDDRAGALHSWFEALVLNRANGPQPAAEHRLVWRTLVGSQPTDARAIDAALAVLGPVRRVQLQRALQSGEEILLFGYEQAPDWVLQITPSSARWAAITSRTPDAIFENLAENPVLKTRYIIGSTDLSGFPEPHPVVASDLPGLLNILHRPPPPSSPSRWLGLPLLLVFIGIGGWFWPKLRP